MAGEVVIKVTGDTSSFKKELTELGGDIGNVMGSATKAASSAGAIFKGVMASQIVTKAVSALTKGFNNATAAGMSFEAQMSEVFALSGATAAEQTLLAETAKEYGASTQFTSTQAGEALKYMALAGWDANESVSALGGVLNLAAAANMDLGRASDVVTDYLSAFGMECDQATYMADLMAYAQSHANTTADQLAEAYGNCASTMHGAGQDIETTTAFLEALANQGIKGSEAGTQMAAVMRDITQKMENGSIMIGNTAVQVMDAEGNFRDLNDIMIDVGKATEGMGTAEASAALMETFTARSVKAVQTVLNEGMDNVNAYEEALRGSEGTAVEQSEKMLDNLQGDVKIFQSALEALEITAYDTFSGTARNIVQEGTSILTVINDAGKTGGLEGMFGAFIDQIPKLLPKATGLLENVLNGLGKKLPSLVKGLVGQIPSIIGSAASLIPSLTDSLFSAASGAISGLLERGPELIMPLLEGLGNTILSVGKGAVGIGKSIITGIKGALKNVGVIDKDVSDVINDAFANVDPVKVDGIPVGDISVGSVTVDGEIDTSAYTEKIAAAKQAIDDAISTLELSDADAEALKKAIMQGSGAEALQSALEALGVDEATAQDAANKLSTAMGIIHDALTDESLNLTEEQQQAILDYVAAGGDIQMALTTIGGLSAEDAERAVRSLKPAIESITGVINSLGIDIDTNELYAACLSANGDIVAALRLMGMDDEQIRQCMASMSTLGSSVATQVETMFGELKAAFTNGVSGDDTAAAEAAQESMDGYVAEVEQKIDTWATQAKEQLSTMNLTADELATKTQQIDEQAASMKATLDDCRAGTQEWITENANASTEVVQAHFDELDSLLTQVEELEARVETLRANLNPAAYATRTAVESGAISNQTLQLESIQLTAKEREAALTEAAVEYQKSLDEAKETYAQANKGFEEELSSASSAHASGQMTDDEYAAAVEDIAARREEAAAALETATKDAEEALKQAQSDADRAYDEHIQAIIMGMIKSNDGLNEAFGEVEDIYNAQLGALNIAKAIEEGTFKNTDFSQEGVLDQVLASLGLSETDIATLSETLGMNVEEFRNAVADALNLNVEDATFTTGLVEYGEQASDTLDTAFKKAFGDDFDTSAMFEVLQRGLNEGWITSTENIDWSADGLRTSIEGVVKSGFENAANNVSVVAQDTFGGALDNVDVSEGGTNAGSNFSSGLAKGISSGRSAVISAATDVANAAVNTVVALLDINSPSKVMEEIGGYTGEGFAVGLNDSIGDAVRSAQSVVGVMNLKPSMDFSGIKNSLGMALSDYGASEGQQEISLYIGASKMATTLAPYNNNAINRFVRTTELGYGRG